MENVRGSFKKEMEIRFCDCDRHNRARPETLLRMMADMAGVAFAQKGYSYDFLLKNKTVFLVTRAAVFIHRFPTADTKVVIETWERDVKGAQYYRDFCICSEAGELLIEGSTAWVAVDPESRRILRPESLQLVFDTHPERKADTLPLGRIKWDGTLTPTGERTIVYSDIDANQHTYNARYVGIACDVLPSEMMDREITDFRISFKQEARQGETLRLETKLEEKRAVVIGMLGDVVSFESEFCFA